ncbi:MAG: methylmalonyl-CoA mutase family protein [Archangium sp.]|nr:methylmalonyl-CoA mutase family protein [Archangium sp.]
MTFPRVTAADWRAQVEKELAGASFEKTLVFKTPEGLSIAPLYTEAPRTHSIGAGAPFKIVMHGSAEDLDEGAEGLWLDARALAALQSRDAFFVIDGALPVGARADLRFALVGQPESAKSISEGYPNGVAAMVSTLADHEAGADSADELAIALSTGVQYLETMLGGGLSPTAAGKQLAVQISVGRDTFAELCKVRALRVCWQKLLAGAKAENGRTLIHAVCSTRTLTQRDPWVNMLRGTTQVFAAVLGGADLVTPMPFDRALTEQSALAHRIARNTGLVLREESSLGRVSDPAGGSYYLETFSDELAREAWKRFQAIEKEGGIAAVRKSGWLQARLDASWKERLELVAKRKAPVLGVSEFANLDEVLPSAPGAIKARRDSEAFEALRDRFALSPTLFPPRGASSPSPAGEREAVALIALGEFATSRARVGFASGFFAAGGLRSRETTSDEKASVACLCGTDERYAAEAVDRVKALKAAGCKRVYLAGRPGALEAPLKEAGIDGFIFMGCDVVATLNEVVS